MRPTGPVEPPIARLAGAGPDQVSRAGVPVFKTALPSLQPKSASSHSISLPDPSSALPNFPLRFAAMLDRSGIPKDRSALLALNALMGEGLSLKPESIQLVRAVALRHGESRRAAMIAARAISAGLDPDDPGFEILLRVLAPPESEDSKKDGGSGTPEGRGDRSGDKNTEGQNKNLARETSQDSDTDDHEQASREGAGNPPGQGDSKGQREQESYRRKGFKKFSCNDESELCKILGAVFLDMGCRTAADPGFRALAAKGYDGRGWLCVPYQFSLNDVAFSGYFRIIFNYASGRTERLVAEIDTAALTRLLDLSWGSSGKLEMRFMPGSASEGAKFDQLFGASAPVVLLPPGGLSNLDEALGPEVDSHA